jgi:hypothetical protein
VPIPPELTSSLFRMFVRPADSDDLDRYVRRLLASDWQSPDSVLKLRDDLPLDRVGPARFFDQARLFLRLTVESGGAPLTRCGWLKRAYVAQMLERLEWPRQESVRARRTWTPNEYDVWPLEVLHSVCRYARLLRKSRGHVNVPGTMRSYLEDGRAGRLYRLLFMTLFQDFELGALYGPIPSDVQSSMAVTLWRLRSVGGEWVPLGELPRELLLADIHALLRGPDSWPHRDVAVVRSQVLEPLEWFGLVERDREPSKRHGLDLSVRFRKTPLFDEFIQFAPFPLPPPVEAS